MPNLSSSLVGRHNQRLNALAPSGIRSFDKKISSIDGLIKLTIGEPDLDTPEHVKQAGIDSIKNNDSHYADQTGKKELRDAISNHLSNKYDLKYDADSEVIVTVGATEALYSTFQTIINKGDKVIVPTPTFALYFPIIEILGGEVIKVDVSEDNFILKPEKLKAILDEYGDSVKALLLNYPSNPTGVEYSKEDLAGLAEVIKQHSMYVLSDEIYSDLTYGVNHYSIANMLPEQTIYLSGLSKSHAMTGYRVGYICGPAEFIKKVGMVHAFVVTSVTNSAQVAAAEALANGENDPIEMAKIYQERRDILYKGLTELGFSMPEPKGAFYMFAKIPAQYGKDDESFALELAKKAKIGVIPGSAFGPGGEGYIRFSYASSKEVILEALKRLQIFMK
ncbi:putative N-acetyl-LL-diaminopimelate aminotransferase PatA [Apilactobacillus kunkeei EFB6]|uniref:Aminotransferase n=1 Tax=Apilactobacillus kunkeei EFB6 TaxID=1419324 RepID=A0A837B096_9LACO|nr:aminotransferase class I/II-fold pyridoxal phosphate-dependent enzyme [Apilactobacillus kunkeei]KDB00433.1 putative N-acetyl-LL-diaminopimelate aminotransferase PatA [Apilactobacillus kunkeei EFB6]